jgi:5-(carboxyamino)imidazole ribonucleotide synthase
VTSQFEQQVRAICGCRSVSRTAAAAAMANLLGDLWVDGEPNWAAACGSRREAALYGKERAAAGRKMGHLTATGRTAAERRTASSPRATRC